MRLPNEYASVEEGWVVQPAYTNELGKSYDRRESTLSISLGVRLL
jgi:hypothetical protein